MPNYVMNKITIVDVVNQSEEKITEILKAIKNEGILKKNYSDDVATLSEDELVRRHPTIDFEKIVPMPESLNIECGSKTTQGIDWWIWKNDRALPVSKRSEPALSDEDYEKVLNFPRWSSREKDLYTKEEIQKLEKYGEDEQTRELGTKAAHNIIEHGAPTWYEWRNRYWGTKWNVCDKGLSEGPHEIRFTTAWSPVYAIAGALSEKYPGVLFPIEGADEFCPSVFDKVMYLNGEEVAEIAGGDDPDAWGEIWEYNDDELAEIMDEMDEDDGDDAATTHWTCEL